MNSEDTYQTIAAPSQGIYTEKGSKFLSYAYPVRNEAEIKGHLEGLRKDHHKARHVCYAYRLGLKKDIYRANDDGEPGNSAGKPILGQIQSKDLTNILIAVVRYFGGTKLGVGGLINAYRSAATEALKNAEILQQQEEEIITINFPYSAMNDVMKLLKDENIKPLKQNFELICNIEFAIRLSRKEVILNQLIKIEELDIL